MGVDKPIEYREKCVSALARGVIGNTAGFGPAIQGSSPCGPASKIRDFAITKRSPFLFGTVLRQTPLGHRASRRCLGINTYLRLGLPPPMWGRLGGAVTPVPAMSRSIKTAAEAGPRFSNVVFAKRTWTAVSNTLKIQLAYCVAISGFAQPPALLEPRASGQLWARGGAGATSKTVAGDIPTAGPKRRFDQDGKGPGSW